MWSTNSLEKTLMLEKIEGQRRRGQKRMRWLGSISDSVDMNLSKLWEVVKEREAWLVAVMVSQSRKRLSNQTTTYLAQMLVWQMQFFKQQGRITNRPWGGLPTNTAWWCFGRRRPLWNLRDLYSLFIYGCKTAFNSWCFFLLKKCLYIYVSC